MTATKRFSIPLLNWLGNAPIESLVFYRITFGLLVLISTLRFIAYGWVEEFYIEPTFHFSYYGFEWLPYPSELALTIIFVILVVSAIGIILGLFYRLSTILFFLGFTYVELLDKTYYLNHYYFVSLIAFLLIFLPANKGYSLDVKLGIAKPQTTIPKWTISIIMFQITVVYFYAGLAKINSDWLLQAQPLKIWLNGASDWPVVGNLMTQDWVAYLFSWFSCAYDLFIVFLLMYSKTRKFGFFLVFIFHFLTWLMFPIGVFPWVMIVGSLIFLDPKLHQKLLQLILPSNNKITSTSYTSTEPNTRIKLFLVCYICFQLLFPFRFVLNSGNLFWTESGYRFSWRVMLMEKAGYATFFITENNKSFEINNREYLTASQEKQMSTQPDMILQYAKYLQEIYTDTSINIHNQTFDFKSPTVNAEIYVTLNGRPSQEFVSPKLDLAKIPINFADRNWLSPYQE